MHPQLGATSQPQLGATISQPQVGSQPMSQPLSQPLLHIEPSLAFRRASRPTRGALQPQGSQADTSQPQDGAATAHPQLGAAISQPQVGAATSQPQEGATSQQAFFAAQRAFSRASKPMRGALQPQGSQAETSQPQDGAAISQPQLGAAISHPQLGAAAQPQS